MITKKLNIYYCPWKRSKRFLETFILCCSVTWVTGKMEQLWLQNRNFLYQEVKAPVCSSSLQSSLFAKWSFSRGLFCSRKFVISWLYCNFNFIIHLLILRGHKLGSHDNCYRNCFVSLGIAWHNMASNCRKALSPSVHLCVYSKCVCTCMYEWCIKVSMTPSSFIP
jgi:hypothetical protein